jgi:hypothetical protein
MQLRVGGRSIARDGRSDWPKNSINRAHAADETQQGEPIEVPVPKTGA